MTKPKLCQNCVKNDQCDVIKMREMRGEVRTKTPKKVMDNPSFHDVIWKTFYTIWHLGQFIILVPKVFEI